MRKKWKESDFECPDCGNTAMVHTAAEEGYYDGDDLYCPVCHCEGQVMADEGEAWDHWDI
jgi:transcription elongation factor Elf1